jgi:4-hydroxy-2-oxoheptanedioate aldolase
MHLVKEIKRGLRIGEYLTTARIEICLLAQVESQKGMGALDDILAAIGLDGVFIGPSDLAADMGFIGKPGQAVVKEAVIGAIKRIVAAGKAAGILTLDKDLQNQCRALGVTFIATEIDVTRYAHNIRRAARNASELLKRQGE